MRRGGLLLTFLVALVFLILAGPVFADTATQNLMSKVIESFDNPEDPEAAEWDSSEWIVRGSKFRTIIKEQEGDEVTIIDEWPKKAYVETWPEALFGVNKEERDLKVLGVNGRFDRQGYNYIELIPAIRNEEGDLVPRRPAVINDEGDIVPGNEITLPGRTKAIDLWVWGSNYDYYLEVHVRDFKGIVHVLPLGNLNYTGWKNLKVDIPNYIPQEGGYVTAGGYLKELQLVKLVLWTRPEENVRDFYVYFDQIKTLTDMFVSRFDGDDLANQEKIQEIWSNGEGE